MVELFRELAADYGLPFVMFCINLFTLHVQNNRNNATVDKLRELIEKLHVQISDQSKEYMSEYKELIEKSIETNNKLSELVRSFLGEKK